VEAEPEPEAVGKRNLLLDRLGGVDRGRALVLDHVARHQMPAVRGGVEQHIGRSALDAALQHRLQGFIAGVGLIEGEVVAEEQEPPLRPAQLLQQQGKRRQVLAMDLDEGELARHFRRDRRMGCLHQRALTGAARAPEQGVVGRESHGETPRVREQDVARLVDPVQQGEIDTIDLRHGLEPAALRMPEKGIGPG